MNPFFPVIKFRSLPIMLGIALLGALVGGIYGTVHDLITYSISNEYFTQLKFKQFKYIDFGFSNFILAAEIGFLATWWVGFFAAWFLARIAVPVWPPGIAFQRAMFGFAIILSVAVAGGLGGYSFSLIHPIELHWLQYGESLQVRDTEAFVRVAYIHNGGYLGALIGLIVAILVLRRQRGRMRETA